VKSCVRGGEKDRGGRVAAAIMMAAAAARGSTVTETVQKPATNHDHDRDSRPSLSGTLAASGPRRQAGCGRRAALWIVLNNLKALSAPAGSLGPSTMIV
jgi:hypothetical protein